MTVCTWTIDPGCGNATWDAASPDDQARAAEFATQVLWAATGRQFGTCPITVRPCLTCHEGPGVYWSDGTYFPYIYNGQWFNGLSCGCMGWCHCGTLPYTQAWLPGPIAGISQVVVGGIVVPSNAYRVDDAQWLVRQDGGTWPMIQNYNDPAGSLDTWEVTLLRGTPVPLALSTAAGTLAVQFLLACNGGTCRFPGYVTSIIRQGVVMEMESTVQLMTNGFTGLYEVDQLIRAYNPRQLTHRLRVWSPDIEVNRITTS